MKFTNKIRKCFLKNWRYFFFLPLILFLLNCASYTGGSASLTLGANYADKYWNSPLPTYGDFNDDCTNFVSASLHNALTPLNFDQAGQNPSSALAWWSYGTNDHSISWSTVGGLYNWMTETLGHSDGNSFMVLSGNTLYSQRSGWNQPPNIVPNGGSGAVVFYNWYSWNSNYSTSANLQSNSHAAILVSYNDAVSSITNPTNGGESAPATGSVVDAHTNSRLHEYWTLQYWNSYWRDTVIVPVTLTNN